MNNHLNMNGMAAANVAGVPAMNNGTNGTTTRTTSDQDRETDYKARLNTYIYDYLLKNEQFDCARQFLNSTLIVNVNKNSPGRRANGVPDGTQDSDSKEDIDSKRPVDLPPPDNPDAFENSSFLLEWFSLFWDMFWAQKGNKNRTGQQALQYMIHTQTQSRMRQEQQNQYLRAQPGMMQGQMPTYPNMMRMQQGGMQMNANDLRTRASQNNLNNMRNMTPQQQQIMARNHQAQLMQQQMDDRSGSDVEMNGGRPRTPSSGDNAPSPSKKPRLDGTPFPQQMNPNGRMPPQGMQGQQMLNYNMQQVEANNLLLQNNINPNNLSQTQLESFQQSNPSTRKKSIAVYAATMAQQHRNSMPQAGVMPGQGSPMMQAGMDAQAGMPDYYATNPTAMRVAGPQGPNANNNHALQDYQMQLMLLEQQNKRRLLMARQEQETLRPDGQPLMPGQQGYPPGMSPQGSRSGPSPNPSDQMRRTPKMGQAGLPGSPMPDGSMGPTRTSPGPMNFNNGMPPEVFQAMKSMESGMAVGPNGAGMRPPPSSHPQFNAQMNSQGLEGMRMQQQQNGGRMPNGVNWQQGPQGQAPMIPQGSQQGQQPQLDTPQQRNAAMPPPQNLPAGSATNGRPASPAQPAAPPTPSQANKTNPKGKKEGEKGRKRPTKKGSVVATPAADAENPPPTPTASTPITPMHNKAFNEQKTGNSQTQASNPQPPVSVPAPAAPVVQPLQEVNVMGQFGTMDGVDPELNMNFSNMDTGDIMEQFDFDSFLQDNGEHDFNLDANMTFGNFDGVEAGAGDP